MCNSHTIYKYIYGSLTIANDSYSYRGVQKLSPIYMNIIK
nr:MAG TPA: hypothetical protein [Caudoviricetes sp.]